MLPLPDFLDLEFYRTSGQVSAVIVQSAILAALISIATLVACIRGSLRKQSQSLLWLGVFCGLYTLWNILYLISYTQRDISLSLGTITAQAAQRGHLIAGLLLPLVAHKFFSLILLERHRLTRLIFFTILCILSIALLPIERTYVLANLITGIFIFFAFGNLFFQLWRVFRRTDNLKQKTRAYFVIVGVGVCSFFSLLGQIRAEGIFQQFPLPYIGNILTAVFLYFLYQMISNPRLREIRELMLRGIRILLLTLVLSVIFISLLVWVGRDDPELYVFNTFIASFIILSILEPLRERIDTFFLKQFIVDRYEFEELLKRLPRRIRSCKTPTELATAAIEGIRESGRIYQAGLYFWDQSTRDFRLAEPSNLNFRPTLTLDHPLIQFFREHRRHVLLEQEGETPEPLRDILRDMHSHMALPLLRGDELLGIWTLRTSLRSTNPYTSFSDQEITRLDFIAQDIVSVLDQLQHFEGQERQKRLAALGEMSAALAHEIRNPLGAIHGACQLLETSPTLLNSEDRECVSILRKETDRMHKTVNQYLSFARSNEEPIDVSLDTLLRKTIKEVELKAQKTNTRLELDVAADLPNLRTDPLKLEQVLFNLIQNACEAFAKNVKVLVSLSSATSIQILVQDDGPGIPESSLGNVFTPLFTTKKAGSGLGLPICKKIIDSLGGNISVESRINVGTTFRIVLPIGGERESRTVNEGSSIDGPNSHRG